jgi:hypothetical protein
VANFERLVLEIDGSSTNPELREHRWLELIVVDLPNQGGIHSWMEGNSITHYGEVILTWISRGWWSWSSYNCCCPCFDFGNLRLEKACLELTNIIF